MQWSRQSVAKVLPYKTIACRFKSFEINEIKVLQYFHKSFDVSYKWFQIAAYRPPILKSFLLSNSFQNRRKIPANYVLDYKEIDIIWCISPPASLSNDPPLYLNIILQCTPIKNLVARNGQASWNCAEHNLYGLPKHRMNPIFKDASRKSCHHFMGEWELKIGSSHLLLYSVPL